ncbi:hypothetical protein OUZ56_024525 [Daphnia magna]|uniref:Uncharacterized protein n=1 Tax=Daphnia magna TaxID=35525 RepID=A0ABR0B0V8_9CRUS|nr:hypothetical protein OUZ56_024525 [Daphnia magna]
MDTVILDQERSFVMDNWNCIKMEVKTLTVVLTTFIFAFVSKQKESLLHSSVSVARTILVPRIVPNPPPCLLL